MNGTDCKSEKHHPNDKVIELEAKLKDAEELIEKLAGALVIDGARFGIDPVIDEALAAYNAWKES